MFLLLSRAIAHLQSLSAAYQGPNDCDKNRNESQHGQRVVEPRAQSQREIGCIYELANGIFPNSEVGDCG